MIESKEGLVQCGACGEACNGKKGLASHLRHRIKAGDKPHEVWKKTQEEAKWADKIEDEDYVRCRECGFRGTTLGTHLRTHGFKAPEYRAKYPGALVRSKSLKIKRSQAIVKTWEGGTRKGAIKGATKQVMCPICDTAHDVSIFLALSMHDLRCEDCRVSAALEEVRVEWEGKSEPKDFVTCRECGRRAENLTSHLQNKHIGLDYKMRFPGAPIVAQNSPVRDKSALRMSATEKDLEPFQDKKGRIIVAAAAEHFGCAQNTMKRRCRELGLPTRNRLAFQKRSLDRVAEVLGHLAYEWEFSDTKIRNPETNYLLRYDGYFPLVNLLVEVHGRQHEQFVPYWHKTKDNFTKRVKLDLFKSKRAREEGYLLLIIRQSDPDKFDEKRLLQRFFDVGVQIPGV